MSSQKLRKYLSYYQKILKSDPSNIEARLRLAAIFRELGKSSHAVEEYVTASKLLATEGLPLEAIAACKAVLELDPTHTEIQFFLARLFAQVPEAAGAARVAKPVESKRTYSDGVSTRFDPSTDEVTEHLDFEEVSLDSEHTSPTDDANTSPLPGDVVDRALTRQHLSSVGREGDSETRIAPYHDRTDAKTVEESFEIGVFDLESIDLDVPSDEIDLAFLNDLDPISEVVSEESLSLESTSSSEEPSPEVIRIQRESLPRIPLFSDLSADAFMRLLQKIELVTVAPGTVLLSADQDENSLFVIVHGEARVTRVVDGAPVELARLEEGDFFGEFRLLTGRHGSATVSASTSVEVFRISEQVIEAVAETNPEIWDVLWEFYYARMLNNLLASSAMFKRLDASDRAALADRFIMKEVVADELLLEHGQACHHLYLLLLGEVAIERSRHGLTEELAALREGEFFGVASSLDGVPYSADVRVVRDSTLLCLPAEDFRTLVEKRPEIEVDIDRFVTSRRQLNDAFTSGMTSYGELGLTKGSRFDE